LLETNVYSRTVQVDPRKVPASIVYIVRDMSSSGFIYELWWQEAMAYCGFIQ